MYSFFCGQSPGTLCWWKEGNGIAISKEAGEEMKYCSKLYDDVITKAEQIFNEYCFLKMAQTKENTGSATLNALQESNAP